MQLSALRVSPVCLSVCSSVLYGLLTFKQKAAEKKNKIDVNVPQGRSNWYVNFQFKRSKMKLIGRRKR